MPTEIVVTTRTGESRTMRLPDFEGEREIRLPGATLSAIDTYGINIKEVIKKNDLTFYLTEVRINEESNYPECLFYVLKDGVLYPRLAYKSVSSMKWKVSPRVEFDDDHHKIYGKGNFSYVLETAPFTELELAFDNSLDTGRYFYRPKVDIEVDPEIDTYNSEIEIDKVPRSLKAIVSADIDYNPLEVGQSHEHFLNAIKPENTPDSFVPNFSKPPLYSYEKSANDRLMGKIKVEVYRVNYEGIDFDFYMARDRMGRIWIEKIEKSDDEGKMISTYGTRKKVSPFQPLCLKPMEYLTQCGALNANTEVRNADGDLILNSDPSKPVDVIVINHTYGDISPLLDKIKIIQKYREAKKIKRKTRAELVAEDKRAVTVKRIRTSVRRLLTLAGFIGIMTLQGDNQEAVEPEIDGWHERTEILPDGEDASEELQDAGTDLKLVITCGQRGDDPKSISRADFIFYNGEYPTHVAGDSTFSHFEGFQEVIPHPLTVCRHEDSGTVWEYSLKR